MLIHRQQSGYEFAIGFLVGLVYGAVAVAALWTLAPR